MHLRTNKKIEQGIEIARVLEDKAEPKSRIAIN
jgi:hypothetical protein